ncbi:S-adenosyl-L-methionine-dependent methyltransferase [Hysterangium stoloniferum]|nr:S-adenosyl-L-methionine-dependent methyltransferase [Hysterangium stoloniferum]
MTALPALSEIHKDVTDSIRARFKFDPNTTIMMDFACGNGAMTALLAPYCKQVIGVDISPGMVAAYKQNMHSKHISNVQGYCTEQGLLPEESQLSGQKFDLIVCASAYKFIEDNLAITRTLKSFLKPGGELFVAEQIRGTNKKMVDSLPLLPSMICHGDGYTEDELRSMFTEAGLTDFTFCEACVKEKDENTMALFLARGVNPP